MKKGSRTNLKFIVSAAKFLTQKSARTFSSEEFESPQSNCSVPFRESVPMASTELLFAAVLLPLPSPSKNTYTQISHRSLQQFHSDLLR